MITPEIHSSKLLKFLTNHSAEIVFENKGAVVSCQSVFYLQFRHSGRTSLNIIRKQVDNYLISALLNNAFSSNSLKDYYQYY